MTEPVWYALRDAVYGRNCSAAEKLLAENPSLVTSRNGIGETVLHFLAVENDGEGVSWLYSRGFSLNEKNKFGIPVLFEVAQLGYRELFLWFLDNGVDLSVRDHDGNNIVQYLLEYENEDMATFVSSRSPIG